MPKKDLLPEWESFSQALAALAHPVRLQMLAGLCRTECNVGQLWKRLGISQPLASQHLRRLQQAGLIIGRRQGQEVCYRIAHPGIAAWLRQMPALFAALPGNVKKSRR